MAGKYFYKGYDINDMIQTGTQNIPGYTNFPKYIKTSGTYGTSDTVKDGFAKFSENQFVSLRGIDEGEKQIYIC